MKVQLMVEGYNLDQLINKLRVKGVVCYDINRMEQNKASLIIGLKDISKAKGCLKNYTYHIKALGIANFKQFILKNLAILIMIPIASVMILVSTNYMWNIKVYGADDELRAQIVDILNDNNIRVGKTLPNNDEVEQILLQQLPNIAQVSCINRGTTLIINVSKKLVYAPQSYEPIVAKFNGIITDFSLISGTLAVEVGEFVEEGDILVYPFTLDKDGNQVDVRPIAEVRAKAYIVGSSKLNATSVELMKTGKKHTTSSIRFLNKNLFSKKLPKPFALYETNVYNQYISSVLPIIKTTITYYELDYTLVNYDLIAERTRIEQESKMLAYNNLPSNSEILDEQTSSIIVNDCLYSTTTLTLSAIIS